MIKTILEAACPNRVYEEHQMNKKIRKQWPAANNGLARGSKKMNSNLFTSATIDEFKWFIQEREGVRLGLGTDDEVLSFTKFSNVCRQDDKTSKYIYRAVRGLKDEELTHNLLWARFVNRIDYLQRILPVSNVEWLKDESFLNQKAYQISSSLVRSRPQTTVRDVIIDDLPKLYPAIHTAIFSTSNVSEAVEAANKAFGGGVKFVMLQVILDCDYLLNSHPDKSNFPIGPGARAIFDNLGELDEVSKLVGLSIVNTEHAACEYRKWLGRQGKNLKHYRYIKDQFGGRL